MLRELITNLIDNALRYGRPAVGGPAPRITVEIASGAPGEPGERVALTPELKRLYEEVALNAGMVKALDGYADIYIKTPKRSNKAYCTVQLQRSRNARLIVTAGILGWPVADLLIRPDSLFVNDMLNNRMLVGRNNGENLGKIIGLDAGAGTRHHELVRHARHRVARGVGSRDPDRRRRSAGPARQPDPGRARRAAAAPRPRRCD